MTTATHKNSGSPLLRSLLASLVGLLAALLVLEILVRLLVPVRTERGVGWSDRPRFYFRAQGGPNMQDYPRTVPKPAGVFRIAVIGDSFSFAPYMQFTDAFPKKLEQMLNLGSSAARSVEVLNYGVPAYSTSHEVKVSEQALRDGADLIILQITLNDPEIKHHTPSGIRENMPDTFAPLALESRAGKLARIWRTYGFVRTRLHNTKTHAAYIQYFTDLFENPRTWKPFTEAMRSLVEQVRASGKPIVAVVFPLFGLPMDERYPFHPIHAKVRDLMHTLSVPLLDLSPIYQGIPLDHLQVIPGVDRHPNEIAHRMAAESLYLWLEPQGLIPQQFLIHDKFATRLGIDDQRRWKGEPVYEQ